MLLNLTFQQKINQEGFFHKGFMAYVCNQGDTEAHILELYVLVGNAYSHILPPEEVVPYVKVFIDAPAPAFRLLLWVIFEWTRFFLKYINHVVVCGNHVCITDVVDTDCSFILKHLAFHWIQ